ncbi:unnamed protein product [Paramecium sonneborni]|uniref:Uncharacterized protein n=1 Tax=Paramecium sonneborni TaxID=65129 RepID=A0A8S1R7T4_9CILI|nr:unnamed protein product [Paramecium sonneborni]
MLFNLSYTNIQIRQTQNYTCILQIYLINYQCYIFYYLVKSLIKLCLFLGTQLFYCYFFLYANSKIDLAENVINQEIKKLIVVKYNFNEILKITSNLNNNLIEQKSIQRQLEFSYKSTLRLRNSQQIPQLLQFQTQLKIQLLFDIYKTYIQFRQFRFLNLFIIILKQYSRSDIVIQTDQNKKTKQNKQIYTKNYENKIQQQLHQLKQIILLKINDIKILKFQEIFL